MIDIEKGEVIINNIVFTRGFDHSVFVNINNSLKTPFHSTNHAANRNEYFFKKGDFNYSIVFKDEKLSFITIEKTVGDKNWSSYVLSKSERIAKNKDLLINMGLEENNLFGGGLLAMSMTQEI
ncbi:hypothetical protein Q4603_21605 [Zobellia galactanivorans]|uniref:hypothetical protein n=1 Tax=Zobellia galactanivorans (strain DSM 12802 / CCUG 47099 / CIP 106680 / NCIMB 13871 / Dsij) TaxID=63186 RepID=UPI0026E19414|nr:hypothetical protein [Zobellia galactanivorans]MDO6811228.1 hypothetical protein [Zobellia galactanivorans]